MDNPKYTYKLKSCVWEITLKCCFSCRYCGSKAGHARENELTTEECISVANQLIDLGCKRVSLIGGEVFMRSDWDIIVKTLTDNGVQVSIITNGYIFNNDMIDILKSIHIESVAVSIDGPKTIHDMYRQKGSFNRAIETIDVLTKNNIPVSIISTIHNKNIDYLDELYDLLKEKNIFAWQLQACSPMGNAVTADFSTNIDFNKVIRFVRKHLNFSPFVIGIADNIGYYVESEGFLRGNKSGVAVFKGCRAGLTSIGIDSIGNVRGCESMYDDCFIEGNLRNETLDSIWNSPNSFVYNRMFTLDKLQGHCANCEKANKCAAGCRSYNYFTHGKLYESLHCARINKK